MKKGIKRALIGVLAALLAWGPVSALAQSAVLLPNGRQQFLDANGNPLASGQVFMYVPPATTTAKTTWQDAARVTPNANPVVLDSAGTALIYGVGGYRQLVKDALGNTIWDAQTSGLGGNTYAGVSTGSANAQVFTTSDFSNTNGERVSFTAGFTNTTSMTFNAGYGAFAVVKDGQGGPTALVGGEVVANNYIVAAWDSLNTRFHLVNTVVPNESGSTVPLNFSLTTSVSGGALTVAVRTASGAVPTPASPVYIPLAPASALGTLASVTISSANSLVISSGSTLGVTANSQPFRLWVFGVRNAATTGMELGVINCTTYDSTTGAFAQFPLGQPRPLATTTEGGIGGADLGQTGYTTTASSSAAWTILGHLDFDSGLAAIGTWSGTPTRTLVHKPGDSVCGAVLQTTSIRSGAVASGATVLPYDDTIPQNTEGNAFLSSVTINAPRPGNILVVTSKLMLSPSVAAVASGAIFRTGSADAIAASGVETTSVTDTVTLVTEGLYLNTGTANQVFSVRAGMSAAGTLTLNGVAAARIFGGVAGSTLEAIEIMS